MGLCKECRKEAESTTVEKGEFRTCDRCGKRY